MNLKFKNTGLQIGGRDINNVMRWGAAVGVMVLLLWGNTYAMARELAIVANKDFPSNAVTVAGVKEIYLGKKMTEGGVKIKPMEYNDKALKRKFIEKVMGSSIDGYKVYWIKKYFQEGITPPTNISSSAALLQSVAQASGGIGYVWADEVKGDGVKVLLKVEVGN